MTERTTALRLLLIDDSDDDALLIVSRFRRAGVEVAYERVDTAEAVHAALRDNPPDAVICDYSMPALCAEDALALLGESGRDLPFILVSGQVGEEIAAGLMKAGAHDFILKGGMSRLVPAVQREVREAAERRHRRATEYALRDSEMRFRLLAEHAKDIIFRYRVRPERAMEYVSPAVTAIIGCKPEDLYADPDLAFNLVDPADHDALRASWHEGEPEQLRVGWHRRDEQVAWTEQRIVAIIDNSGQVVAVEGILRDVTDQVLAEQHRARLERELAQSERLDSLGRLAGGIAHDFNNLLAVISGYATMLADDTDPDDARGADISAIQHAANRAAALTRQLLIFSRSEPSHPRAVDLNAVIRDTDHLLARTLGEDLDITLDLRPDLGAVHIDPTKIEQVLLNLVMNARAAMPDGGVLTISTDRVVDPDTGGLRRPGPYVSLTVADTGVGMPPEVAARAFEPFYTTRSAGQGTGLGLATAYGAVTEAGGDIMIESAVGRGTTMRVLLPAIDHVLTEPAAPAAVESPAGRGETVLVVEDEDAVRDIARRILTRAGYQVITAGVPARALELYREHEEIAAVLSDVVMPGMSGFQLAVEMRQLRPAMPILFMSGYPEGLTAGGRELPTGAQLILKPFDAPTLVTRLGELIHAGT